MAATPINLTDLQAKVAELEKTTSKMNLGDVFAERNLSYLNEFNLFIAHFNSIPILLTKQTLTAKKPASGLWKRIRLKSRTFILTSCI